MSRIDPFFRTRAPHRSSYLESLHRQWTPPERDDFAFQKALTFREREKAKYRALDQENATLKQTLERYRTQHEGAMNRVRQIEELFDKLSKQKPKDANRPKPGDSGDSVPRVPRDVKAVANEEHAGVSEQVLPSDVGGQAEEHAAEGSESRSGVGDEHSDEPEGTVPDGGQ